MFGLEVHHQADLMSALTAISLDRRPMSAQQLVGGDGRLEQVPVAGRQYPVQVAAVGHHPGLIQRRPQLDPVVELAEHDRGVLGKPLGCIGIEPTAAVIECRRQIPVVERHHGCNAVAEQRIRKAVVEGEPGRIDRARALRDHAAPGDAEAVGREAQLPHQRDIIRVAAIVVTGDIAGITVAHQAGGVRETLPDARRSTVGERGAFDLICRSRTTPQEIRWKGDGAPRPCYRTMLRRMPRKRFLSPRDANFIRVRAGAHRALSARAYAAR